MNRFVIASLLLIFLITGSIYLNNKIISAADTMINLIDSQADIDKITEYYDKNKLIFSLILSKEQIQDIKTYIDNLKTDNYDVKNQLKTEMIKIKDSMKVSIYNIL